MKHTPGPWKVIERPKHTDLPCERCGLICDGLHDGKYCDLCYKKVEDARDYVSSVRREYNRAKGRL